MNGVHPKLYLHIRYLENDRVSVSAKFLITSSRNWIPDKSEFQWELTSSASLMQNAIDGYMVTKLKYLSDDK